MNVVGENFPQQIIDQINVRQRKKGALNRDAELLTWINSNTGWVRMVSSVDIDKDRYNLANAPFNNSNSPLGSELAENFILHGGMSSRSSYYYESAFDGLATDGSLLNSNAYGLGGLEFGIKPMPGITSFNIKTENRGSLKTATIGIKAYNRAQFDIINTLYLSLGYSVLIEWGNNMGYDNKENFFTNNNFSLAYDFLSGKLKWDDILLNISKNRLDSNGNYDAALCKVVNFSWTVNRDLSYDITLTVRSIGDVIESLKINTLSGNIKVANTPSKSNSTNPTASEIIANFANSSDIGALLYDIQVKLKKQKISSAGASYYPDFAPYEAVRQTYDGSKEEYFIRLGYFLELIQKYIMPDVVKENNTAKYMTFDTDVETNIILLSSRQVSADPSICLFNTSYNKKTIQFIQEAESFKFYDSDAKCFFGKFMNVYFNMTFIISLLKNLVGSDGKVVLIDLLRALSDGFCSATGNYNSIEPTVNEDNKIVFIDDTPLPNILRDKIIKKANPDASATEAYFILYGFNSTPEGNLAGIVRDLNLTTTITPQLASMITIGAQANAYITGQDSTALSTINRGLTDRIKPEIVYPQENKKPDEPAKSLEEQYSTQISAFNKFLSTIGSVSGSIPKWDQNAIDEFKNANASFIEYNQYSETRNAQLSSSITSSNYPSSPTIGFIPFGLTLTMDGLSGMKVYQKFTVDTNFLPSNYPESLEFVIKGITNEIKDNQWITTIESFAIPKNPFGTPDTPTTTNGRVQGSTPITRTDGCKTSYREFPFSPVPPSTTLSYDTAVKYLKSKYPDSVSKAVFAVMFAEAKKQGNAFVSAGGYNYAGVQTDAGRWSASGIIGQFCRTDNGGYKRAFAIFENDNSFLDFMASRIIAKGIDGNNGDSWTQLYINKWWSPEAKASYTKGTPAYNNILAKYSSALKRYNNIA